ncbi:hypothetical protein SUGI_0048560 [Cryptomeria japonica]|nr:hypothetical protein SUGI_0048560 [Cryptomeria japonica]
MYVSTNLKLNPQNFSNHSIELKTINLQISSGYQIDVAGNSCITIKEKFISYSECGEVGIWFWWRKSLRAYIFYNSMRWIPSWGPLSN